MADKRADLDLQISLLADHDVTRLITLVAAMAERVGLDVGPPSRLSCPKTWHRKKSGEDGSAGT